MRLELTVGLRRLGLGKRIRNIDFYQMTSVKTNPKLWEEVKAEFMARTDYGGPGWNARKAQAAVREYKNRGGGFVGPKPTAANNSLMRWTKEDWGYIVEGNSNTRYLPAEVRNQLTPKEITKETKSKKDRKGQHVPYSDSVLEKFRNRK